MALRFKKTKVSMAIIIAFVMVATKSLKKWAY
jgi:hypothetical protein